jgi:hypothetical protein
MFNRDIYRSDNIVIQDSVINNGDGMPLESVLESLTAKLNPARLRFL